MAIRLVITPTAAAAGADGSKPVPQEVRLDDDEIVIGRDKTCQVALSEQSVSRNHARITREGSLYFIEDMGSAFGTRVNGQQLPKGEKRLLRNGDLIAVGTFDIAFSRPLEVTKPQEDLSDSTGALARSVVKEALRGMKAESNPYLRVMNGPLEGRRFEMSSASELRRPGASDRAADHPARRRPHQPPPRQAAARDWSGSHVEDLGSRNGVRVNRKSIKGPTTLKDGDEVEIGGTRLLYVDSNAPAEVRVVPSIADPDPPAVSSRPRIGGGEGCPNL